MATVRDSQRLQDQAAELRQRLVDLLGSRLSGEPGLADDIDRRLVDLLGAGGNGGPPKDNGLAALVGLGDAAAADLADTRLPGKVEEYDESVASERILAIADLYYIYQHERLGVFRVVRKLEELFRAGTLRLSDGPGAYALYRFDRRRVLRYTRQDRAAAYQRAFGYGTVPAPAGGRPNRDFHPHFTAFAAEVAAFWRDKRVSDVIRERAYDPSFGSIAVVRRSGLDLRNNLKFASYGHINVLRVEVMALLEEAMTLLGAADIREQFGADNAWDVVEEVLTRYFREPLSTSLRQRLAVSGRELLRWVAEPYVLQSNRAQFEALLLRVAEYAEEWVTSAEALGLTGARQRRPAALPWDPRRSQAHTRRTAAE
ncbi:hypothetical protein [Nucisporomicrobium flavum]|uniref:hypothetical protein n=1 Tax=Nucisporomicrobium flavum TaxID=2785915 RepID=UPI0018F74252|nr:hypothetical protein [Nucisporomicrobium flavum]